MPSIPNAIPVFGSPEPSLHYHDRQAAYCVVKNVYGDVAVVRSKSGRYFLPGGGALEGEKPEQTLYREVREELACELRILYRIGGVVQYFHADGKDYRMVALFFAAEFGSLSGNTPEHKLIWVEPRQAESKFFHACHVWAIQHSHPQTDLADRRRKTLDNITTRYR